MTRPAWRRHLAGVWLELRVIPVLLWSFSAIALGTGLAARDGDVAEGWLLAALAVGWLLQGVVAHCVNEVTDWRSGTDRDPAPRLLSGGSKVIRAGLLDERQLIRLAVAAGATATAIGFVVADRRGWWLLALGAMGLAGAVAYTLPPVALAYVPFAGETVAFLCVAASALGGFGVQAGGLTGAAVLVAGAHAAYCVSMLMLHHYLDRGPDSRADPPKVTSIVRLGGGAKPYAVGWAALAAVLAALAVITVDLRLLPLLGGAAVAVAAHAGVRPDDPDSVTRAEAIVIAAGILGALVTAILLSPGLVWLALFPVVLVPLEFGIAARWLPGPGDHPIGPHGGPPSPGPHSPRRA